MLLRTPLIALLLSAALWPAGPATARWFGPASFWNSPLPASAPVDERSEAWVRRLVEKADLRGTWINTSQFSVPIYRVGPRQPGVTVVIDSYETEFQAPFRTVPLPSGARPAAGTDRHLVVHQPSTDTMWEFWNLHRRGDGSWHAGSGARILAVSKSSGIVPSVSTRRFPSAFGATATGLPLAGGLITPGELASGAIHHVLALAIPKPLAGWWWRWPAQRSDGDSLDPCDVPEGARFRLPAGLDVSSLGLSPTGAALARAVQRYGAVVRDRADAVTFYAQDPVTMAANPYPRLFGGRSPAEALARFPWSRLEVVASRPNRALPEPPSMMSPLLRLC